MESKRKTDLNSYECAMLNDFELYIVHRVSAEIEKWSILSTKVDYVDYNRKELSTYRVILNATENRCQKGYKQTKGECRTCQEIDFDNMTLQLQTDYLDR